ncbi:hypothetical protein SAMN02745150_01389 [Brevinema andersonii]|uniref:Uncharacterized protein n=1 Tax=Brevinema andersonii TaxID=34097 RepID=A0A1I1F4Y8_BREAD|nr:hypothetical protein [Brevinema andersonii]SFB94016.1 hypothetical protein SAMN02745150_01389 [Brevinema andersonii]
MKLILLRLKLLCSRCSTRNFLKVLFISFPVILCVMYYIITKYHHANEINSLYKKVEIISEKSASNDNQTIIHHSLLRESNSLSFESSAHFWEGTALESKYLLPHKGKPSP